MMLTFSTGIFKQIMKPAGIEYKLEQRGKKSLSDCRVSNQPDVWDFMFNPDIVAIMAQGDFNAALSSMNKATFDRVSATVRDTLYLELKTHSVLIRKQYEHLLNIVFDHAVIKSIVDKVDSPNSLQFSKEYNDRFYSNNKEDVKKAREEIISNLSKKLKTLEAVILEDKRFKGEIEGFIKEQIDNNPVRVLGLLCIFALFEENESDKEFVEQLLGKYINGYDVKDEPLFDEKIIRFENELLANSKELLNRWEAEQNHEIDYDLLASCTVKGQEYKNLYEYVKESIGYEPQKNCVVRASGGSGKTASLVYACKQILMKNESVIPMFIQMRKVDSKVEKPISTYIYNNIVNNIDVATPYELKNQFMHNLDVYLKKTNKQLIVVLDGCNECDDAAMKDIADIKALANTIVIASSRIKSEGMDEFITVHMHSLDVKTVNRYLEKYNISIDKTNDLGNLRLPIFIYMMAQICSEQSDAQERLANIINQASVINTWIKSDIDKQVRVFVENKKDICFACNIYLPLLAMLVFFKSNPNKHRSLYVSEDIYDDVENELLEIFKNKGFAKKVSRRFDIDISEYIDINFDNLIRDILVAKFGFLKKEEEDIIFSWTHECYRDFFIAKGLDLLRKCSPELSDTYMDKMLNDAFRYPRAFTEYKDYSAYSVAVYYAELVGEDLLTTINDTKYHRLIRNIAFFADDLGDSDSVIEYANYMTRRDDNPKVATPLYDKASSLSGMAYSLIRTCEVHKRPDSEKIISNAFEMLEEANKCIVQILGCSIDLECIVNKNFMELSPKQVEEYFDGNIDKAFESISKLGALQDDIDVDNTDANNIGGAKLEAVLALYARIYGNYGGYYLYQHDHGGGRDELMIADRMHVIGAFIKHYILKHSQGEAIGGRTPEHALAISYKSISSDIYRDGNYDLALEYLAFSREHFKTPEDFRMMTISEGIICRIARTEDSNITEELAVIVQETIESTEYFKKNRMRGEVDKLLKHLVNYVGRLKKADLDSESQKVFERLLLQMEIIIDSFALDYVF